MSDFCTVPLSGVRLSAVEESGETSLRYGLRPSRLHMDSRKRNRGTQSVLYAWPMPHQPSQHHPLPKRKVV